MSGRVALVTDASHLALSADDRLLLPELERLGCTGIPVAWDDPAAAWPSYDAVVVRSPWDYHKRYGTFLEWLARLERAQPAVFNPVRTLRWNADKSYLAGLAQAGIRVIPTEWVPMGAGESLSSLAQRRGWRDVVVKPTVSGGAWMTWRVPGVSAADDEAMAAARAERAFMVQPYQAAIEDSGELSLIFLGGVFSHAVLKRPAAGDFRVQEDVGGTSEPVSVEPGVINQAARALSAAPTPCLYARVDGYVEGGQFVLMELEVLEPSLFLVHQPLAAARFAAAIRQGLVAGKVARSAGTSVRSTIR